MMTSLEASYESCRAFARRTARNFYYSFWVLPRAKRAAMCALYAFFRRTDDLGDSEAPVAERRAALQAWREAWRRALTDDYADPLLPAIVDVVRRYDVPAEYLETAIDGVESDLNRTRFATFDELAEYCYQVASVVGLASIHIWGFRREAPAYEAARRCGFAFQLTNILRDVGEDAQLGRVYLPQDELARFGLTDDDLLRDGDLLGAGEQRWRELFQFQVNRAAGYYREARALTPFLEPDGLAVFGAMYDIYFSLFEKVRRSNGDVFTRRLRLAGWHKAAIAGKHYFKSLLRRREPSGAKLMAGTHSP